MYLRTRLCLEC